MNPPLPKAAEKRGDTVPKEAFVDGTPKMVDMPASKEERIAQAKRIEEVTKNGVKIRPTPGTFTYLSPEYRRERAQSALDTYHQALNSVIAEDPDSPNAQIATIVKNDLDTHFKKQVAGLQKALERTQEREKDRAATQQEIYSGKRSDSLFVGKEIKRPDIQKMIAKSLDAIKEEGKDNDGADSAETIQNKEDFISALTDEIVALEPTNRNNRTTTTPPQEPAAAPAPAVQPEAQSQEANGLVNLINHFDTQEKIHGIPAPESQKDLPRIPDMEPGQKVKLENADTSETDTWTIDALENGTATLKRVINGKEEIRTYPAGKLKDIMRLNAYYENALAHKEVETQREQQETAQSARKVLRSEWRKKQNLGRGDFIKPTEHIQKPETAEDLPDIGIIKPGQIITLQDIESREVAKWTVSKIENGIAFIEREKEGGEKEERNLPIDRLREILKTNLYYKNALRAEQEATAEKPKAVKKEPQVQEKPLSLEERMKRFSFTAEHIAALTEDERKIVEQAVEREERYRNKIAFSDEWLNIEHKLRFLYLATTIDTPEKRQDVFRKLQIALEKGTIPPTIQEERKHAETFHKKIEQLVKSGKLITFPGTNTTITSYAGRVIALTKIYNRYVPFYASTSGTSGKQAGKWYPFLGVDPTDLWLAKPSLEELETGFGIQEVQELQNLLNQQLRAIPLYAISDELLEIKEMSEGDTIDTFLKHKLFPELSLEPKAGEKPDRVRYTQQAIALLAKDIGAAKKETEQQQELKVGDTISLLNKKKTAPHNWIIESISQEGNTTRVYLKSKDGAHSLRLPLEEVLGGIEATNEWKANPDNKKESFSNPPVGELIKIFNENRKDRRALYELYVEWDNKYIASGLIDQMREKNGNIAVSAEQIESTKKLLQAYKKILELDANESYIPGIRIETELEGNIVTLAKILSGKTTTKSREDRNNIETLVSGYSATGAAYQLERLEKAIQGAKPFTTQQNQEKPKEGESKKPEMGPDGMPSAFEAVYEKLAETQGWAQKEVDTLKKDLRELSLTHSHYAVKMIRANIIKRDLMNTVEQLSKRMDDYILYAQTYEDFFRESANGTFAVDDDKRVKSVLFIQTLSGTQKLIEEIPNVTEQVFKSIDERLQKPDVNPIQVPPTFTYTHTKQPGNNQSPRQKQRPSQEDVSRVDAMAETIQKNTEKKWGKLGATIGTFAVTAVMILGAFGSKSKQEKEVSAAATPPVATKTAETPSKVTQWNHPEWFQNINESKEKDIARMIGRTDSKQFLRSFIINPDMEGKPIATPQSYESIYNTIGLKANVPYAAYFDTEREITPETAVQVNNSYFDLRVNMGKAVKALIEAQDRVGLGVRPELPKVTPQEGESFSEYFGRVQKAIGTQLQKKDSPYQV